MQNTEFILVLLFINYCIIFHTNDCKPTCAPPCASKSSGEDQIRLGSHPPPKQGWVLLRGMEFSPTWTMWNRLSHRKEVVEKTQWKENILVVKTLFTTVHCGEGHDVSSVFEKATLLLHPYHKYAQPCAHTCTHITFFLNLVSNPANLCAFKCSCCGHVFRLLLVTNLWLLSSLSTSVSVYCTVAQMWPNWDRVPWSFHLYLNCFVTFTCD